jgi:hypothetical protein
MSRPGLPRGTDAELHVYRAAELGYAVRGGVLYPRWAPNLFLGYGYPIFNYYAPLTYYLANVFALVPGASIVTGVKAVFVLGLLLAAIGSYALGRDLFGRAPGIVCAASFTFAPYVVLIDPHARGDLAEHFALCLLPLAFAAMHRLMSGRGGRAAFAGTVVTVAAVVFSHNLVGLLAAFLMAGYWAWEVLVGAGRRGAALGLAALAIAAACSAFFWLPALLEWGAVELTVTGPGHFDFRNHFLSIAELLGPSPVLDLRAAAPAYRFNLGVAQWVLALPALLGLRGRQVRRRVGYFVIVGACLAALTLKPSLAVWERVPGLEFLQFPWRLLGPANMALAACAAAATSLLARGRRRARVPAVALTAVLATSLPVLYPPMWSAEFGGTGPTDIIAWEAATGALGTTSTRDFVPQGAALVPMYPTDSLIASYGAPGPVDKVNRATLARGTHVAVVDHGPQHDRFLTSSEKPFLLRLYTFEFPGWRAYINDVSTDIEVAAPEGFITVQVPAGQHDVEVRFEDTAPRTAGWTVAAVGLLCLLAVLSFGWRSPAGGGFRERQQAAAEPRGEAGLLWLGGVVAAFVLLKGALVDRNDSWMRYTSPPGEALPAAETASAVFGDEIELIGYSIAPTTVRPGGDVSVTLYWWAVRPPSGDYQSFVHLARPLNVIWGQEDHLNPGELPTTRWPLDKYVRDEYTVRVLPGTPPGQHELNVGLYSMAGGYRLTRSDAELHGADGIVLTTVNVTRPRREPDPATLGMTDLVTGTFASEGVTLVGYIQQQRKVNKDEAWTLTLFWKAEKDAPDFWRRDLLLMGEDGVEALRLSAGPAGYAAVNWSAEQIVRDPIAVPPAVDANVAPGRYLLALEVFAGPDARPSRVVIGKAKIRDR